MAKLFKTKCLVLITLFCPFITLAAFNLGVNTTSTIGDFFTYTLEIVNLLTPILFGAAFIVFFWGLSKFILNSNKPEDIKNGRSKMLWGILALFVLMTFRVLIGLVANELEIGNQTMNDNTIKSDVLLKSN